MPRPILRRAARLLPDARGASAVEFALILPLMITLYVGGVDFTQAIGANRKVTDLARTIGDIVSKSSELGGSDLTQLAALSGPLLGPSDPSKAAVTIMTVWTDDKAVSKVDWSFKAAGNGMSAGSAPGPGSVYPLPGSLTTSARQTVVAIVEYPFTPAIGSALTGTLRLSETVYFSPRSGKCVKRTDVQGQLCSR